MLYPDRPPLDMARQWLDEGPRLIIVTDGDREVVGMTENEVQRVPVSPVEVVDAVGAGDTFMATLL
ncbi:carbohydrate kinase, partial [Enterococcus hirae]